MAIICPAVLAEYPEDFNQQMSVVGKFAERVQIDLMDGQFTPNQSVNLDEIWWPHHIQADIHLMYQDPFKYLEKLLHLKPNMVIVHVETMIHHMHFAAELHKEGIKVGLAILPDTPVANIEQIINSFDHLLIFSGNLGHFGGQADLSQIDKVNEAKAHHPDLEIGWDGGINDQNIKTLVDGGVDVLDVGGFIAKASDPALAYKILLENIV